MLTEDSSAGEGFLADLCRDWESATQPVADSPMRLVNVRTGLVLSLRGGALSKMHLPFKLGLGGAFGSGRQCMSWITLEDVTGAIGHALEEDELRGPVNLVAPNAVSNATFTRTLGSVLRRPTVMTVPAFALRALLGEMAEEMLLFRASEFSQPDCWHPATGFIIPNLRPLCGPFWRPNNCALAAYGCWRRPVCAFSAVLSLSEQ
jgi:uncharacterized protein (TIGR01777 family)